MDLIEGLQSSPLFLAASVFLIGACIGSFINVVAYRLPKMMEAGWRQEARGFLNLPEQAEPRLGLAYPASACPACNAPIRARHNIPVLGWLWLRGRCADCSAPISGRYPLVELASGVLAALCAWKFGWGWPLAGALLLTWTLLSLSLIDLDTQLLPDSMTLPLLWLGLVFAIFDVFTPLPSAVIGAMAGYLSLWSVFHLFRLLTGKEGMGHGDFKLLAALGAWFGWQALPLIILLSSAVGAVVGIGMIVLLRHDRRTPIPFGPYLAGAGWIMLLWGADLSQAYLDAVM